MATPFPSPFFRGPAASILGAALACAPLAAAAAPLSIDDAVRIAVRDNKDLHAARFAIDQARARRVQSGLPPNPQLEVSTDSDLPFQNRGEYTARIGISQAFPLAGRLARQRDVAQADIALAEAALRQAEARLAGEVALDLLQLQALDRQEHLRDRMIEDDELLAKVTRSRFKAAEVSELDVNAAQLDLQRLRQERAALEMQRATQQFRLDLLLGRDGTQPVETAPGDEAPAIASPPPLDALQRRALQSRPDLQLAELAVDRARADQALARAERWQDVTVAVGVQQGHPVIDGAPPQGSDRSVGISVSIPLPLVSRNQGRMAEALSAHDEAQARVDALRFAILGEVAAARAEVVRGQSALDAYQRDMLPLSERNVRLARKGYQQGLVPIVDVIQAQRQLGELNAAWLEARDRYQQARARLDAATGANLAPLEELDR